MTDYPALFTRTAGTVPGRVVPPYQTPMNDPGYEAAPDDA